MGARTTKSHNIFLDSSSDVDEEASQDSARCFVGAEYQRILQPLGLTTQKAERRRDELRQLAMRYEVECLGASSYERLQVLRDCMQKKQVHRQILSTAMTAHGGPTARLDAQVELLEAERLMKQTKQELEQSGFWCLVPADPEEVLVERQIRDIQRWERAFDDWVHTLNGLTPKLFVEIVTLLRIEYNQENLNRFLRSLSLELTWNRVEARIQEMFSWKDPKRHLSPWELFKPQERNFCVIGCENGRELDRFDESISQKKFPEGGNCYQVLREFASKTFGGQHALIFEATYSISPAVQLFELSDMDLTLTLKALVDAGQGSQCFNTVLGKAIVRESLRRTIGFRLLDGFVDVLIVILLAHLGYKVQIQQKPETRTLWSFGALGIWVCIACLGRVLSGLRLFWDSAHPCSSFLAAIAKHLTLWNSLITLSELFSVYVGMRFLSCLNDPDLVGFDFFQAHPVMISALVLIRWTLLAIDFFQFEEIGRRVVPIVHAASRPASVYFLFFLALMLAGSFQAYRVFPIEENIGGANKVLDTFLKIFRLEVLGDFDLNELEGINDKLTGRVETSNGTIHGDVDADPSDWSDKYHRGVRFEFMALSLGVTVVVMNVYIGLLGSLYDNATKRKNQLYAHYLASCCYRHLCLRLLLWQLCCWGAPCAACHEDAEDEGAGERLYWLAYEKDTLLDGNDD
ncbi:unnamed protein product [Symbiodinium necroappetens]|uniref:Uncharacterized protein n=1 Tax=Symbiodinium necroappetens TaxID=1628268 RepID=A0A813BZ37_9DINO|nr:unnamed protein product [Symbiodinium necroappetens]